MIICDTKGRGHEEGSIKNLPDQHNAGFSSDAKYSLSRANTYNAANTWNRDRLDATLHYDAEIREHNKYV